MRQLFSLVIALFGIVFFTFVWVVWVASKVDPFKGPKALEGGSGSGVDSDHNHLYHRQLFRRATRNPHYFKHLNEVPTIYDVKISPKNYEIEGFRHFNTTLPVPIKSKKLRSLVKNGGYLLGSESIFKLNAFKKNINDYEGRFVFTRPIFKNRVPNNLSILLTYHLSEFGGAKLTIYGTSWNSRDETMEQINLTEDTLCSKHIFLGPVKKVEIFGSVQSEKDFILIEQLKIGTGNMKDWENDLPLDEYECV